MWIAAIMHIPTSAEKIEFKQCMSSAEDNARQLMVVELASR